MNPYGNTQRELSAPGSPPSPPPYSSPGPHSNPSLSSTSPSSPVIQTTQTYLTVLSFAPHQASSSHEAPSLVPSSGLPLPASDQGSGFSSGFSSTLPPTSPPDQTGSSPSAPNPYPAPSTPPSLQVSVVVPSPDDHRRPSPPPPGRSEDACLDLECSICFSQFNNVFRCPKVLRCGHTFCLECLARINVKSADPEAVQCPLCRGFTPLPALGLPKLTTDSAVLACLPATMQKVYSIRFQRNKGKLRVKRSGETRCPVNLPNFQVLLLLLSLFSIHNESLLKRHWLRLHAHRCLLPHKPTF